MKQQDDSNSSSITAGGTCGHCGLEERRFLPHVHHRGVFRRLCTNCLLRLHPHSFCPSCFIVYESPTTLIPLPSNHAVSCSKCYSSSHISCVGPAPSKPYNCPLCTNPNSPLFVLKDSKDQEGCKEIDKKAARVLLAAGKTAAGSMNKAAAVAKVVAERRAKEAAISRKRAKEAMEYLACTEHSEKLKKDLGSGNYRNALASSIVGNVGEKNSLGDRLNIMDRLDNSSAVLAAFNVVELKEKARLERVKSEIGVLTVNGDLKTTKIEKKVQNNGAGDEKEKFGDLGQRLSNGSA